MTSAAKHTAGTAAGARVAMRSRKDDFVKPDHLTLEQWLFRLEIDRADINRQISREIHTRGFVHGKYCERLDRAIFFARAALAKAEGGAA